MFGSGQNNPKLLQNGVDMRKKEAVEINMAVDMIQARHTGIAAAYQAGEILLRYLGNVKDIRKKGRIDLVTEADTASEARIIEIIKASFPNHGILAEESGHRPQQDSYTWIIDPLDGTVNFAHGLPFFGISIALVSDQTTLLGLVFNPLGNELFYAEKSGGAFLNHRKIAVSNTDTLVESLVCTGFPYDLKSDFENLTRRFNQCLKSVQGMRRLGSAALDLCYLACGRFDGFWEQNLAVWDFAAGALIASEAGAVVSEYSGASHTLSSKTILATNGLIHSEMIRILTESDGL